jgi:hypothetical protein
MSPLLFISEISPASAAAFLDSLTYQTTYSSPPTDTAAPNLTRCQNLLGKAQNDGDIIFEDTFHIE